MSPPAADRFAYIIGVLCQAVAARGVAIGPIHILIHKRLSRIGVRFARLVALVRAGELPSATAAGSRAARQAKSRASDDPADRRADSRAGRLPRGLAWLFRLVPASTALASQMNHLLSDPEMVALLQAAPQMGRLLRPLCQMLGIRLSDHPLLLPPRTREAASPSGAPADGESVLLTRHCEAKAKRSMTIR